MLGEEKKQDSAERMRLKQNALINALRHSETYQGGEEAHNNHFENENSQIDIIDYQYTKDEDDQVLSEQLKHTSDNPLEHPLRLPVSPRLDEDSPKAAHLSAEEKVLYRRNKLTLHEIHQTLKDLELSLRARTGTYLLEHPLVRTFHTYKQSKVAEMH